MPLALTQDEINSLTAARALCPVGDEKATAGGNWVPFYEALFSIINSRLAVANLDVSTSPEDRATLNEVSRWLSVAINANGGQGMHSTFIRTYTNYQSLLRTNHEVSSSEMQYASNQVALNVWKALNGTSPNGQTVPWQIPTLAEIADYDAKAIGDSLFGTLRLGGQAPLLVDGDTAVSENAAWSGTLGFSLLGGAPPHETERLYSAEVPSTAAGAAPQTGSPVNRVDDVKNILFAVASYQYAYARTPVTFAGFLAQLNIALIDPAIVHLKVRNTPSCGGDANHRHEKPDARSASREARASDPSAQSFAHV